MEIQDLRNSINEIDRELVRLFRARMEQARKIAEFKKENNLPVSDRTREREILHTLTGEIDEPLAVYLKSLYNTIFELSKTYQRSCLRPESPLLAEIDKALDTTEKFLPARSVVACQGTEGAYSQFAADRLFSCPSIHYTDTFEGVLEAVESGRCRYGILPLENSTAGSVTAVYELMQRHKFYIVASTRLCIGHCLLANEGATLSDISEIFSHEQALNQCSEYLSSLDGVKLSKYANTALAARTLAKSGRKDAAVICSADCAELYGLKQIAGSISNTENNYTRFICISKSLEIFPGANRTSLMARLPHRPGALYNMISRFAALGVNLTKLESRPVKGSNFDFLFYFDIDSAIHSHELREVLAQLECDVPELVYLGSYHEI